MEGLFGKPTVVNDVAMRTGLAHMIVTEGLVDGSFVRERCEWDPFQDWAERRIQLVRKVMEPKNGYAD